MPVLCCSRGLCVCCPLALTLALTATLPDDQVNDMQTRGVHWFPPSNSRNYLALGIVTAVENAIDSQFYCI